MAGLPETPAASLLMKADDPLTLEAAAISQSILEKLIESYILKLIRIETIKIGAPR